MNKKLSTLVIALILAVVSLAGCSGLQGSAPTPTITAIPLPSEAPQAGFRPGQGSAPAGAESALPPGTGPRTRATSPIAGAAATPMPTEISSLPPATQLPQGMATAGATASPTQVPPTPTLTSTPSPTPNPTPIPPTPTAQPVKPVAHTVPTSTPPYSGKLVFQTALGGELYVVDAAGTGLRRLTDGIDPIWSPDGTQVAFTRYRDPRGVWVISADGSDARQLFAWSEARWPSWSPDGSQILFTRQHGGQEELTKCFRGFCFTRPARFDWRLAVTNENSGSFNEPPSALLSLSPDWSPQGDRLVYAAGHGLMIENLDGSNAYNITDDADDIDPVWSPAGAAVPRVVFTRRQHDHWELYAVDTSGANLDRLTDTPARPDGTPASSVAAAWSPGGKYIAFYTDRSGKWEIWVMKSDGSDEHPMFGKALDGLTLGYSFNGDRALSWTR